MIVHRVHSTNRVWQNQTETNMKAKPKFTEACWAIHTELKGSCLAPAVFKRVEQELKLMIRFFGLGKMNCILLCSIIQECLLDGEVGMKSLATYYNLGSHQLAQFHQSIEELCEAGLIEKNEQGLMRHGRKVAPMPFVLEALMRGDKQKLKPKNIQGLLDFFKEYERLQGLRKKGNIDHPRFNGQVVQLCERSTKLPGIQYFQSFKLSPEELGMLIYIAHTTFKGAETVEVSEVIKEVTDERFDYFDWCSRFRIKNVALLKEELIEFSYFELGIETDISLTQLSREKLFSKEADALLQVFKPELTHYVLAENIKPVDLIFDDDLHQQLASIKKSLMPSNFVRMTKKLKEQNLTGGITILLHGHPGTGKTESVYQIARATERAVLRLEISKIKAMWVGESEKNLKKVFTEYKKAKRTHPHDPILLFNEADAIFSKRRNVGSSVDQMENSLQNILLQELEEFEGILIATTNLTQNLDVAFERRFLYKLEYNVPREEARYKLLVNNFKNLDAGELHSIATTHAFTGSTIENIKRKIVLNELLGNSEILNPEQLKILLADESHGFQKRNAIGFRLGEG
jgi:SpoVK/Ycf46/Vps4 family AAA+-type ATPase